MIEIRDVKNEDIPVIHALGEHVDEFRTSDQAPNFWPEPVLLNCVDKEDVYFQVAASDEEVVGFIIANINASLGKVLIENIFVRPDYRGQGIGTNLTRKIIDLARAAEYPFIAVLTPPDDIAAIKTYEKAGFSKGETFLWLDV